VYRLRDGGGLRHDFVERPVCVYGALNQSIAQVQGAIDYGVELEEYRATESTGAEAAWFPVVQSRPPHLDNSTSYRSGLRRSR